MNEARSQILNGIRRSLQRGELSGDALKTVEARLAEPPRGPAVARAALAQPDKVALFCQWAEANNATVARVAPAEVAAEVSAYLARNNLPAEAVIAPSPQLAGYDWSSQKMLSLRRGRSEGSDHVSITGAFVVLRESDIVAGYEEVWERLRARYGKDSMPRTVNTITGPSRTGDIEQAMELGAHGPRRMHVLVVRE
jgi:L-lactate dehydrogenase complex protein LldG